MTVKLAPRNGDQAGKWLREQQNEDRRYPRECLILQREARGIPSLAPSAYTASLLVPKSERIIAIKNFRHGMVCFSKGADPAGHIFYIIGRKKGYDLEDPHGILTRTNDADNDAPGAIRVVPLSFYGAQWNHRILFSATWLNGYDFADFNEKPKPVHPSLGKNYEAAIEDIRRVIHAHRDDKDQTTLNAVKRDLVRMERKYKRLHVA